MIKHIGRQRWKQVARYYRHLFTNMCEVDMVDFNNRWHIISLRKVLQVEIQEDVDLFVASWSDHKVRFINNNGHYIAGLVPEVAFKELEQCRGWVKEPIVSTADNA